MPEKSSRSSLASELDLITSQLDALNETIKAAERDKKKLRDQFFVAADKMVALDGLARKTIGFPDFVGYDVTATAEMGFRFTPDEWIAREYPGWMILDTGLDAETRELKAVIQEVPALQPFTWVNNTLGKKFSRQRSMVESGVDIDWLWEEFPEVAGRVTHEEIVQVFDEEAAHLYLGENPGSQAVFEKVCYDGKPQMKLAAPTKIKDDE